VPFSNITEKYIAASLSPAKVTEVDLHEDEKRAVVSVPEDQQSLAIGKEGQNARLANKLTRWKIDIKGSGGLFEEEKVEKEASASKEKKSVVGIWDSEIKKAPKKSKKEETTEDLAEDVDEKVEVQEDQNS